MHRSEGVCHPFPLQEGPAQPHTHPPTGAGDTKTLLGKRGLVWRGTQAFPQAESGGFSLLRPPSHVGGRVTEPSQETALEYAVQMGISLPTRAFQWIHFLKPRSPTESAKMSHRPRRATDRQTDREPCLRARKPDNPAPLPPRQDINSHKSEKITMHECKKHDQE